ncbi:MAG: hypothetical protein NT003_01855, partial [Candidatus Magasanikbacteria bacterium]|nr:hypothetical protein [Candidatus Magasanikbacteria bacterium]
MKLNWMQCAIIFTAAATPLYLMRFHIGPIPMTVFETLILLLAGATCVRAIMDFTARDLYIKKIRKIPRSLAAATILFFIASCISVFVAPS